MLFLRCMLLTDGLCGASSCFQVLVRVLLWVVLVNILIGLPAHFIFEFFTHYTIGDSAA